MRTLVKKKTLLQVRNLITRYGLITALHGVSIDIAKGEIVCIIGPNGAGKSTLMKTIAGMLPAAAGEIVFESERIDGIPSYQIVGRGIALVPEGRRVFGPLSVRDNLQLGAYLNLRAGRRSDVAESFAFVLDLFPRLKERLTQMAGSLSGGEQQMLAIGRALMSRPRLLLLDEPSMGLAPLVIRDIFANVQRLYEAGLTILLAEQNARLALRVAQRGYIFDSGSIVAMESAQALRNNAALMQAYIGV